MRILVISNLYPPNVIGGYERLCFEVTQGLAAQGHEMTVLTSKFGGGQQDYPQQVVLRTLNLLTGPDIYTPFSGTAEDRARINATNLQILQQVLEDVQPDVVFSWNLFFLDASMLTQLEYSRFRTVVMLTDNWLLVMRNGAYVAEFFREYVHGGKEFSTAITELAPKPSGSFIERIAGRFTRRKQSMQPKTAANDRLEAIFGSAFMRDFYTAGGSRFQRHRVIHNGVKQSSYAEAPLIDRTKLATPGILRLLFAGRLVDLKGADIAVKALALLIPEASHAERVELTIVGDAQDAAYMSTLDAAIAQSSVGNNITIRAAVAETELLNLFNTHDIYLFPSRYEPFSLTLIHALACGIPTIASRVGGNPEIIVDGLNGLLFQKDDAQGLARAIERLARDSGLRSRIAQNGREAASGFTFEKMIREMAEFLQTPANSETNAN